MKTDALKPAKTFLLAHCGQNRSVLAAVSGGLDSMCLLHLLHTWGRTQGFAVTAAHFNHQLRGETADRDEAFVRDYCQENGIPFAAGRGDTRALANAEGLTVEEAARRLRYAFLERTAADAGCACILTAHHADDNAETMLLNLIRGTGSRGLAGIPPVRGNIRRPFLDISQPVLAAYAAEHGVPHVEDETNREDIAARNLLRHEVLPVLRQLNSRAVEHMSAAAKALAREDEAMAALAAAVTAQAEKTETGLRIPCAALENAPAAVAERAVLDLLERGCGRRKDLSAAHVEAVLRLARGGDGGEAALPYGLLARRAERQLFLEPMPRRAAEVPLRLDGETVWGGYLLRCEKKVAWGVPKPPGVLLNWKRIDGAVTVGPWRSGDGLTVGWGKRSLKRLFAEGRIPPHERDTTPVFYVGGVAVAALGVAVDAAFAPEPGGTVLEITARRRVSEIKESTDNEQ